MTIQPIAIRKSQGLIRLISNTNNVNFSIVDSFLPIDFKTIYEDDVGSIFYPFSANHPDLYHLKTLPKNYFICIEDSLTDIAKKEKLKGNTSI